MDSFNIFIKFFKVNFAYSLNDIKTQNNILTVLINNELQINLKNLSRLKSKTIPF